MLQTLWTKLLYASTGLVAVFILRFFVLPGSSRRRKLLGFYFVNFGGVPKDVSPRTLPEVEQLSPRVIRVLGLNPGSFTLQGTNTYIVGNGKERILIDCGVGKPSYAKLLKQVLHNEGAVLKYVLITHYHIDHIAGLKDVRQLFPKVKVFKRKRFKTESDLDGKSFKDVDNGDIFKVPGASLRVVSTPGHCSDHIAFFLEEEKSIFTGDCILGSGTSVFDNLHQYMGSLKVLQREIQSASESSPPNPSGIGVGVLYPGHGQVIEKGLEKITAYINHRLLRENQIMDLLKSAPAGSLTVHEIVEQVYKDQHLNWIVKRGALRAVRQHIDKLEKENRVKVFKGQISYKID